MALTALLTGGLVAFLGVRNSRMTLESQILADSQSAADLAAQFTRSYVESAKDPLLKTSASPGVQESVRTGLRPETERFLAILRAGQPSILDIAMYDPDGQLFAHALTAAPALMDVSQQPWFVSTRANRSQLLGLPTISTVNGQPAFSIAIPMIDPAGTLLSVIYGSFSLQAVANDLALREGSLSRRVTLVDRREGGIVLATQEFPRILKPFPANSEVGHAVLSGERTSLSSVNQESEDVLTAITPVTGLPWAVVLEQSKDAAFAPVDRLTRQTLLIAIPIMLAVCLLSAAVALQISRPLARLRRAVERLADGEERLELDFKQKDEIGELGRAFDQMADALEERSEALELTLQELRIEVLVRERVEASLRIAHDELEMRVQERTAELAVANTDLKRSNSELEQFAYVASHDLQEPLRMVSNYTQLLSRRYRGRLDENADTFIGYAVEGARRMQQLINDLLDFSRVGTKGKEFAATDLNATLDSVLSNLELAIEETGARIERGVLPAIFADEAQIAQLLQNLIGNAIKFRGDRVPMVEVGAERVDGCWVFHVRDNGIGIDQQYHERIFVLFQRLHTREEYAGTGIGLAICKRIVERHGGRIWIESTAGEGTCFYFTLAAAEPETAEHTPVESLQAA